MQKDQSQYLSKQQGMKNWEYTSFQVFAAVDSVLGHDKVLWSVLTFEKSLLPSSPLIVLSHNPTGNRPHKTGHHILINPYPANVENMVSS